MTAKLDPILRAQLRILQHEKAQLGEARADLAAGAPVLVIVNFTGDVADLVEAGFRVESVDEFRDEGYWMATGTVPLDRMEELASIDHVLQVNHSRQGWPLLDYSLPAIHANAVHQGSPSRKGTGVVIGVIDSGIDWRHSDFVTPEGKSRIIAIWDQLLTAKPGETAGMGSLGVVYTQQQLNDALEGKATVRTFDLGIKKDTEDERSKGHGTHVAGIAAGDGSSAACCHGRNTYIGVAPLAQLIVVRTDISEAHLISAISFILDHPIASVKPVVINMSVGGLLGPHDGTLDVEQQITMRVGQRTGRAIVVAAGNSGDPKEQPCHVRATVPANNSVEIEFTIAEGLASDAFVDFWYERAGRLNTTVTAPGGTVIGPANHGAQVGPSPADPTAAVNRRTNVNLVSTINGQFNRDNNMIVWIQKPADGSVLPGPWKVRLTNPTATPVNFHGWTKPTTVVQFLAPVDSPDGKVRASRDSTVEQPGCSPGAVTVANYAPKTGCCDCWPTNDIVHDSSRGPVARDALNNPKPDIAAPGLEIAAPAADAANLRGNCCSCCPDACCCLYVDNSGTSMAAPHVAGAIALMLEENPNLAKADIVRILKATAGPPLNPADPQNPNNWGAGKLNVEDAIKKVRQEAGGGTPVTGGGGGNGPLPIAPRFLDDSSPPPAPIGGQWLMDTLDPGNGHHHPPVPFGFLALRERIAGLGDGGRLAAAVSRHFSEVRRLINTNRRVATMWHRANGPGLLRGLLAPGCAGYTLGEREQRYLARFFEQLELCGSPRLRKGLHLYGSEFLGSLLPPIGVPA